MKATLTYHSIDESGSPISVSPSAFAAHRAWLTSGRVRVLSLDALAAHPDEGDDAVAVCFDDSFRNAGGPASTLLAEGLPVTLFAVTAHVGGVNVWGGRVDRRIPVLPLLDWDELRRLAEDGATIAAHTRRHPSLARLSDTAIDEELQGSLDDLRATLGQDAVHVAYPYGVVTERVEARAARAFRFGHTMDFRVMTRAESPLRLPRLDMYYFQRPGALDAWGQPSFARRVSWIAWRRRVRARVIGGWSSRGG